MKKLLVVLVILIGVPLLAITGWLRYRTADVESEAAKFEEWSRSQKLVPVEFVVTTPPETPAEQTLYLSGSAPELGNWDAAGKPMERVTPGKYRATVELMSGVEHQFKVTRGTWGTVERGTSGADIPNHSFVVAATRPAPVVATVETWVDGGKSVPGRMTMAGEMRLHKKWHSNVLGNDRTIAVYLPPNYGAEADRRYPVLYLQDGQNLFDESTAFAGVEWRVDETAQALISDGKIEPFIAVGIYNTERRTDEFTPPSLAAPSQKAAGDKYATMIVEELKPFVDKTYRTQPDKAHTAIGGSSMGALAAIYVAKSSPTAFGQMALLTPHLRAGGRTVVSDLSGTADFLKGTRLWLDMGSAGGANYPGDDPIGDAREFVALLQSAGVTRGKNFAYEEFEGGEHNEPAWANRIDHVLLFLYGK